jgi:hypothetical protein
MNNMTTGNKTGGMKMKCTICGEFKADQINSDVTGHLNGHPICVKCTVELALSSLSLGRDGA